MTQPSDQGDPGPAERPDQPTGGEPQAQPPGPPPQPPAGPPPAAPPPPPGQPPSGSGYNVMAILSLVFAFVFSPAGIVLGHVAKRQIKQSNEQGDSLATAGLVLSYVFTALAVVTCCIVGVAIIIAGGEATTNY